MYDEAVVQYFLEHQMQLFKENVAESPEEGRRIFRGLHGSCLQKYQRSPCLF